MMDLLPPAPPLVDRLIDHALQEDLASGDLTTEACIDRDRIATGHARARHAMVVCGGFVFARVFERLDPAVTIIAHHADGAQVAAGATLWELHGRARALLMGERVALNLVQRMCGIATTTRGYVDALPPGSPTRITDTRKTTPGLRVLERYAVRAGGGRNHRDDLGSAVLIKDNHIVACGGIGPAVARARLSAPHTCRIECEVDNLDQLDEAIAAGADIVLLDNMPTPIIEQAVLRVAGRAILEASGGIALTRVAEIARAGVHAISVGALTHSVSASDIGLDFEG